MAQTQLCGGTHSFADHCLHVVAVYSHQVAMSQATILLLGMLLGLAQQHPKLHASQVTCKELK